MVKRKTLAFLSQFFFLPWPTALCLSLCHGSVHSGRVCVEMEGCCGSGFDWHLGPRDFLCCFSQRKQDRWREKRRRTKKRGRAWETSRDEGKREGEIFRRNRSPSVRQSNHGPSQTSSIITIWLWYDGRVLTPSGRARLWRGGGGRPAGQGRAGCARAWTRGCGLVCFNRADVTAAGGLNGPLSCHSSGWVSRQEPGLRLPDYRVVTIAVRLLTTWHPRTLHPFKCCFVSLRQIGELPSSKRRVRDGYKRKKTTNGEVLELHAVLALWWSNSCFSSLRYRTKRREPTGTLYCSEVALSMLTKLYWFFLLISP